MASRWSTVDAGDDAGRILDRRRVSGCVQPFKGVIGPGLGAGGSFAVKPRGLRAKITRDVGGICGVTDVRSAPLALLAGPRSSVQLL
jgi:hypothetical protein